MKKSIIFLCCILIIIFSGCSRYHDTVSPIKLPSGKKMVVFDGGIKVVAHLITNDKVVGFDIKSSKVIPVKVVINNESSNPAYIVGSQCFLIDSDNNAWPILSYDRVIQRIKNNTIIGETLSGTTKPTLLGGLLGAVGGLAIGILTDKNIAESAAKGAAVGAAAGAAMGGAEAYSKTESKISQDIAEKEVTVKEIQPNMITYGFLYFPGEAKNPVKLKFALKIKNKLEIKEINLTY